MAQPGSWARLPAGTARAYGRHHDLEGARPGRRPMKAVVMHETGDPEVLREEEVDRPEPGDGEVLLRVHAASVNPVDWKYRRGLAEKQMPAVLGQDVSGTVEVSRVEGLAEGDDVFGFAPSGGYAEFATAPAGAIARKLG